MQMIRLTRDDREELLNERICRLAEKANEVWHEYFPCILSEEQITYMVEIFQSEKALREQLANGYEYILLEQDGEILGYTGLHAEPGRLFLSKLYLMKPYRGKGYASILLNEILNYAKERNCESVYLTVNRNNEHSIAVYKRKGFQVIRSQTADIGHGYVMDDYVMELILPHPQVH